MVFRRGLTGHKSRTLVKFFSATSNKPRLLELKSLQKYLGSTTTEELKVKNNAASSKIPKVIEILHRIETKNEGLKVEEIKIPSKDAPNDVKEYNKYSRNTARNGTIHKTRELELLDAVKLMNVGTQNSVGMTPATTESNALKPTIGKLKSFDELPLPSWLIGSLALKSITQPTQLQQQIIESMLEESPGKKLRPILIRGQTGTGKSLGYIVSLLAKMHKEKPLKQMNGVASCFHLVLVPNSILAEQLLRWIKLLIPESYQTNNRLSNVVRMLTTEKLNVEDGKPPIDQEASPNEPTSDVGFSHILIASPKRVRDLLAQGKFNLGSLQTIIIDEADALLKPLSQYATMKEKMNRIRHPIPTMCLLDEIKNTCREYDLYFPRLVVTSASLSKRCREDLVKAGHLTGSYTLIQDFVRPTCPSAIKHFYRKLSDSKNVEELVQIIRWIWIENSGELGALFIPSSQSKKLMKEWLDNVDIQSHILSDLPTDDHSSLNKIITDGSPLLIGSDVDSRGWDIPTLKYVIIVDLPGSPTHYLHMAGRVGRMGKVGNVYSLVAGDADLQRLTNIFSMLRIQSIPYIPQD